MSSLLKAVKRGPYKESEEAYLKAIELRKQGLGYSRIGKLVDKHPMVVRDWVKHIAAPDAHALYSQGLIRPFEELKSKSQIRVRILEDRGRCCEECKNTHWLNKPMTLEVDHINGNTKDNRKENLKLLCPNCHSYTPTWKRKKSSL